MLERHLKFMFLAIELKVFAMSQGHPPPSASLFGLSFGWSYALAAFTLTLTASLPLALLAVMNFEGTGPERAHALMVGIPSMAAIVAIACTAFYFLNLRHRLNWHRHALLAMWGLSALSMVGWWKL